MPHMLAQEHMGFVDAIRYGTTLDQSTISAALAAIGSTPATLVLTNTGTGVWAVNSGITIPTNVILLIPQGVTISIASGVTLAIAGQLFAYNNAWKQGPGSYTINVTNATQFNSILATVMTVSNGATGSPLGVNQGTGSGGPFTGLFVDNGGAGAGLTMSRVSSNTTLSWEFYAKSDGWMYWGHPGGSPVMAFGPPGMAIGQAIANGTSGHLLQLANGDAAYPSGGPWLSSTSDARVKDVLGDYLDGTTMLKQLQPKNYQFNGKAATPAGEQNIGLIADDVETVAPYMVGSRERYLNPSDPAPTPIKTLNTNALTYALINAVKELDSRLTALGG